MIVAAVLLARPAQLHVAPAIGQHGPGIGLPGGQVLALLCTVVEGALVNWSALVLKERTDASARQVKRKAESLKIERPIGVAQERR